MVNTENISALSQIINLIPRLTDLESDQLRAMLGVGVQNSATARGSTNQPKAGSSSRAQGQQQNAAKPKTAKKRGNPARKSQWITNPLYVEYSRLKKVVEAQAKEAKIAFNAIATPEKASYDAAFTSWMEEKQSFRVPEKEHKGDVSDAGQSDAEMEESTETGAESKLTPVEEILVRHGALALVNAAQAAGKATSLAKKRAGSRSNSNPPNASKQRTAGESSSNGRAGPKNRGG
jgi:hypothetical protein